MKKHSHHHGRVSLRGTIAWRVVGPDGKEKSRGDIENLVVTSGLTALAGRLGDATPANNCLATHIAVGTGVTAPAAGDTVLETEIAREALTSRTFSGGVAALATVFNAGDIPGVPVTIRELGLFIDSTDTTDAATLFSRAPANIEVTALDALFVDWRITLSDDGA